MITQEQMEAVAKIMPELQAQRRARNKQFADQMTVDFYNKMLELANQVETANLNSSDPAPE